MPTYPVNRMAVTGGAARGYAQGAQQRFGNQLALRQTALAERGQQHAEKTTKEQEDRARRQLQHDIETAEREMQFKWADLDVQKRTAVMNYATNYEQNRLTGRGQELTERLAYNKAASDRILQDLVDQRADVRQSRDWWGTYWNNAYKSNRDYVNGLNLNTDQAQKTLDTLNYQLQKTADLSWTEHQYKLEEQSEKFGREVGLGERMYATVQPGEEFAMGGVTVKRSRPPAAGKQPAGAATMNANRDMLARSWLGWDQAQQWLQEKRIPQEQWPKFAYDFADRQLSQGWGKGGKRQAEGPKPLSPEFRLRVRQYARDVIQGSNAFTPPTPEEAQRIEEYTVALENYYSGQGQGGGQGGGQPQGQSQAQGLPPELVEQARAAGLTDQQIQSAMQTPNPVIAIQTLVETKKAFQSQTTGPSQAGYGSGIVDSATSAMLKQQGWSDADIGGYIMAVEYQRRGHRLDARMQQLLTRGNVIRQMMQRRGPARPAGRAVRDQQPMGYGGGAVRG